VVFTGDLAADLDERQYQAGYGPCMDAAETGQSILIKNVQLQEAMRSRAQIEQAKGILMRDYGCTADEAFQRLVNASNRTNRTLRDIARALVESTRARHPKV
jgi:hypothetical protein